MTESCLDNNSSEAVLTSKSSRCGVYSKSLCCYYHGERLRLHERLKKYAGLSPIQRVYGIEISQNGIYPTPCCMLYSSKAVFAVAKYLNKHQTRIKKSILSVFYSNSLSFPSPSTFSDFDSYFDFVAAHSGLVHKNCLLVYDYCLRTGYAHGLVPDKYVYLFQGALVGAKKVLGSIKSFRVDTKILQVALGTTMLSYEIEDYLCVCKDVL